VNNCIDVLDDVFGEEIMYRGLWPVQSHALSPCDFCLWGTLKEKVSVNNLHSLEELQESI
jgi:hypothetical protein